MNQGIIEVHNPELCSEILDDRLLRLESELPSSSEDDNTNKTTNINASQHVPQRLPSRSSTSQAIHAVEWLSRKARRAVVALPDDPELTWLKTTCEQISREEHAFFSEVNQLLAEEEGHERSKKAMLYKKWTERVFEPIHKEVVRKMNSTDYNIHDNNKRKLFDKYLHYSTRQDVFLDTVSRDEYNPDKVTHLKVSTGTLSDPLRAQYTDADHEDRVIQGGEQGLVSKPMTSGTSCAQRGAEAILWLAMELIYIDSASSQTRRSGVSVDHNKCSDGNNEGQLRIPHRRRGDFNNKQPVSLQWKE